MVTLVTPAPTVVADVDMLLDVDCPAHVPHAATKVPPTVAISTLYPVGRGAVGVRHDTTIELAVVETVAPLTMLGTVDVVGHEGATIEVVEEAPAPSDVSGVTRYVYTVPGVRPVITVVSKGTPTDELPRLGDTVVHEVPPLSLCSSM
jgi:hypothetical protein